MCSAGRPSRWALAHILVLTFVFSVLANRLAGKSISEMIYFVTSGIYKNSSGDEIANVNFYAVRPEGTRIRSNNAK